MSTPKVRAREEFDRAVRAAYARGDNGAYAYALGLVESKVPADHLLWSAALMDERYPAEPTETPEPTPYCPCQGWLQENSDGPHCGSCGHHSSDHYSDTATAGCGYDPDEDDL